MGKVKEFVESGALGWDVTREEFLTKLLEELPEYPDVVIVCTGQTTMMYNRKHVKISVKVVKSANGSSEQGN